MSEGQMGQELQDLYCTADSHVCAVQQTVRNIPLPALSNGLYSDIKFFNEDNAITKIYYLLIEKGGILKKGY